MLIEWQYFPKHDSCPNHLTEVLGVFHKHASVIDSATCTLGSDAVLSVIRDDLLQHDYQVELDKTTQGKIRIPVLIGRNGIWEKSFEADAFSAEHKTVIEVEAGRGVTNNQFLKDLFEACMVQDTEYLVIAVRRCYRTNKDFERVCTFFETLYAGRRLDLPLRGILIIGY